MPEKTLLPGNNFSAMTQFYSHAGISVTSVKIQVSEIVEKQNKYFLSNLDEVYFNDEIDFAKDKETKILSLLNASFGELQIKNLIASNTVSFSLPQELFVTAQLQIEPSLLYSDLIEDFRWHLSIRYPYLNWNDYVIRFYEIGDNKALVFAIDRKHLKIISDFCTSNKLKLKFIDHCHLSANNILISNSMVKKENILSFYISEKILSVLAASTDKPIYYEDIPMVDIKNVSQLIKNSISRLNQIKINCDQAYLFGNLISHAIANKLTESVGIKFVIINPFTELKAEVLLLANKFYSESNHFFSPSAGVAIRV